jgi:pimeloyl-ACP methyl ester carboxylesterase
MDCVIEVLQELGGLALYLAAGPLGLVWRSPCTRTSALESRPIGFVPGWLTGNPLYRCLKRRLEPEGIAVHLPQLGLMAGDHVAIAQRVGEFIEHRQLENVVLVGASMGGIVGYVYAERLGGWSRVARLICIGSALQGSERSHLACFSRAARQMRSGSSFMKWLHARPPQHPERIVCLSAARDEIVPRWSTRLPGVSHEVLDVTGHVNLQAFSRRTVGAIVRHARSA